jgi:hypothetical protein
MNTVVPGVPATSINSDIANTTAGTAFAVPYSKQGIGLAVQLVYTGVVSAVSIAVQISLDNSNWATIATSTNTSGEYIQCGPVICKFIRLYHTSRTGGTNVLGTLLLL